MDQPHLCLDPGRPNDYNSTHGSPGPKSQISPPRWVLKISRLMVGVDPPHGHGFLGCFLVYSTTMGMAKGEIKVLAVYSTCTLYRVIDLDLDPYPLGLFRPSR